MALIHVAPLADLQETAAVSGALLLITLLQDQDVDRPTTIAADHHHHIEIADIERPCAGLICPNEWHVRSIVAVASSWDQAEPLLISCWGGISRSTAAAFIVACAIDVAREEGEIAWDLRQRASSARPNLLLIAIADRLLGRRGRMVDAICDIDDGDGSTGRPFSLEVGRASIV